MNISESSLVGTCPALVELRVLVSKLAASMAPVLVTGESGTGKDLVARAIHTASARHAGPFVVINCAALTAERVERDLFGATGLFVAANGGTLYLDYIAELPLDVQPQLLRALQERCVRPPGSTREVPFDARVIASTNRDLDVLCQQGHFRDDLRFRLQVLTVPVPPLRARGADVHLLATQMLARSAVLSGKPIASFTPEAAAVLGGYRWPGNVRELENAIAHALALAGSERIGLADLPFAIRRSVRRPLVPDDDSLFTLEEVERRHVARVLDRVAGNKSAAARVLGIERRTLYRMIERWRE